MALYVICAALLVLAVGLQLRNMAVYRYRRSLIDQIHQAALRDLAVGRAWEWRYRYFDRVSYDAMVLRAWRSLDSFYPSKAFVDPLAVAER